MHLRTLFRSLVILLALLLAFASGAAELSDFDNGQSSFRDLGDDFSVEVPVVPYKAKGVRLALVNNRLLDYLRSAGFDFPTDPKELEKWFVSHLSLRVDKTGKSPTKMIATRYQDSDKIAPGEALGDGRAVITGEIRIQAPNGKIIYLDVLIKGVGQTPLAWFNHTLSLHKDGDQSMDEAAHSFIHSEAAFRNGILGTVDLAVLELPFMRPGSDPDSDGHPVPAAITIRIGNQSRLAHLDYFKTDPKNFKKIYEMALKRDLGLEMNTKVTEEMVKDHLALFTSELAHQTSFYYDSIGLHGSPTNGNRTTNGGGIDFGTFHYLDAFHPDYSYIFDQLKLGGNYGQIDQIKSYIDNILYDLNQADYKKRPDAKYQRQLYKLFDRVFKEELTKRGLIRLGLSNEQIEELPRTTKDAFYVAYRSIYEKKGRKVRTQGQDSQLAAFDVRKILSQSIEAASSSPSDRRKAWRKAFRNTRSWRPRWLPSYIPREQRSYERAVGDVYRRLRPSNEERENMIARANSIAAHVRPDPGLRKVLTQDKAYETSQEVLRSIYRKEDFQKTSAIAEAAIQRLVDRAEEGPEDPQTCLVRNTQELLAQ